MKVVARYIAGKVIAHSEIQCESIDSARSKLCQVVPPKLLVVIPTLVLDRADKRSRHAANLIRRPVRSRFGKCKPSESVGTHTPGDFQYAVHQASCVGSVDQYRRPSPK